MNGGRGGHAILLGCGTSTGVPLIGCPCSVCHSGDPRNRRLRASLWFELASTRVLIDTSTDLRQQALTHQLPGVDAVLFTHAHADHVHGIDDMRTFNFLQRSSIPCYASDEIFDLMLQRFAYIFRPDQSYPSALPRLTLEPFSDPIQVGSLNIVPVPLWHGRERIYGFRIGDFAYLTDIKRLADGAKERLEGVKTAVLGALRHEAHPTHMTVEEAIELSQELGFDRTVLTHMSHDLEYQRLRRRLPAGVEPGFDGLVLPISS